MSKYFARLLFFLTVLLVMSACSAKEQTAPLTEQTPKIAETRTAITPTIAGSANSQKPQEDDQQDENAANLKEVLTNQGNLETPPAQLDTTAKRPEFDSFVAQIKNGNPSQIVGVYIENILALRVVQQPPNDSGYVSTIKGVVTQFLLAYQAPGQNIGLLAHNYLSGILFFNIKVGNVAQLIYGDGRVEEYEVTDYREYQAITPDSPNSDFIDLTSGEKLSAGDLFQRIYTGEHHLVFQTCINQDNIDTWGRLFVLSFPY